MRVGSVLDRPRPLGTPERGVRRRNRASRARVVLTLPDICRAVVIVRGVWKLVPLSLAGVSR